MSSRHLQFLKIAKKLALKTTECKRQFGAVIVRRNRVVAMGRNRKSHPKVPRAFGQLNEHRYYGLHAEIGALLKCNFDIRGCIIYVYGQNIRSGKPVYAKPCELCTPFIKERGIKSAVFVTKQGYEVLNFMNNKI